MSPNSNNNDIAREVEKTLFAHVAKENKAWEALDNEDKKDFIGTWLLESNDHEELVDRAMESVLINDQTETRDELSEWDDELLIEKILDDITESDVEAFSDIYEGDI